MIRRRYPFITFAAVLLALAGGAAPAWGQQWGASEEALRKCEQGDIAECKLIGRNLESQLNAMRPARMPQVPEVERQQYWALGKACELGDGEACYMLGDVRNPTGLFGAPRTPENYAGSAAALKRACDTHKIAQACRLLPGILESRSNPQRDEVAAKAYRERADKLEQSQTESFAALLPAARPTTSPPARPADPSIAEHIRKYGKVDGLAPAEPGLLKLLMERRAANGNSLLKEEDIAAIRNHLLADGRIDEVERELVAELTYPDIRAVRVYRAGAADAWEAEGTTFASILRTRRDGLLALLDAPALTWDDSDRKGTLMRLARASRTPGMEEPVKALIAGKVSEAAPASTKETGFAPLRPLISDMIGAVQALEADGTLDKAAGAGVRNIYHEAISRGIAQSGAEIPGFLYNWIRQTR